MFYCSIQIIVVFRVGKIFNEKYIGLDNANKLHLKHRAYFRFRSGQLRSDTRQPPIRNSYYNMPLPGILSSKRVRFLLEFSSHLFFLSSSVDQKLADPT